MKKICLLVLVLFFCLVGNSQVVLYRSSDVITVGDFRLQAGKNFFLPRYADTTAANLDKGIDSCGALIYIGADVSIYYRSCNPKKWSKLYSGTPSTNYIDTLRRSSDSVYGRKNGVYYFQYKDSVGGGSNDTTSLSNRINARVQYIDTSGMLAPYFRRSLSSNDTIKTNGKVLQINATSASKSSTLRVDTTGLIGYVTTGSNLANFSLYPTYIILGQVVGANENVISMQPASGIDIYSLNASTRDGINTVSGLGSFWYTDNYDTIGVLPRVNGTTGQTLKLGAGAQLIWANDSTGATDTSSLSSRINQRIQYSDSSAMLSPYLRKLDTASLSSRIDQRLLISDTSVFQRKQLDAYSFQANGTGVAANSTATYFKDTSGTYTGTITWSNSSPTGTTSHTYRWTRIGKMVTLEISLVYGTVSAANNTNVIVTLPSDAPTPSEPSGLTAASAYMYPAYCNGGNVVTTSNTQTYRGGLRNNAANNGYEIIMSFNAATFIYYTVTVTYWTD